MTSLACERAAVDTRIVHRQTPLRLYANRTQHSTNIQYALNLIPGAPALSTDRFPAAPVPEAEARADRLLAVAAAQAGARVREQSVRGRCGAQGPRPDAESVRNAGKRDGATARVYGFRGARPPHRK